MKSKKDQNKLTLKKSTVVNLENKEMSGVLGGFDFTGQGRKCGESVLCSNICEW